jgi:hypothetical protein
VRLLDAPDKRQNQFDSYALGLDGVAAGRAIIPFLNCSTASRFFSDRGRRRGFPSFAALNHPASLAGREIVIKKYPQRLV